MTLSDWLFVQWKEIHVHLLTGRRFKSRAAASKQPDTCFSEQLVQSPLLKSKFMLTAKPVVV